jgi:hypothetical protein
LFEGRCACEAKALPVKHASSPMQKNFPFVGCLFTFSAVSFEAQKFLILTCPADLVFHLLFVLLVLYVGNYNQIQGHKNVSLCFLPELYSVSLT